MLPHKHNSKSSSSDFEKKSTSTSMFSLNSLMKKKKNSSHNSNSNNSSPRSSETNKKKQNKALTKPERNNLDDPNNANYYYAQKVKSSTNAVVLASTTGIDPLIENYNKSSDLINNGTKQNMDKQEIKNYSQKKLGRTDTFWIVYCYIVTFWATPKILKWFGMPTQERQMAWREKIALLSLIFYCGSIITFLTFGFNSAFCKPKTLIDIPFNQINNNQVLINGLIYLKSDFDIFKLNQEIGGEDISFLFQNVNGNCKGIVQNKKFSNDEVPYYYPCTITKKTLKPSTCINSPEQREYFYNLKPEGVAMYTWDNVTKIENQSLVVYDGNVIDLSLINYLKKISDIITPSEFDLLLNGDYNGYDISYLFSDYARGQQVGRCLVEVAKIGTVDSETVGCVTSKAVLSISLIIIVCIIFLKFLVAVYYAWAVAPFQGVSKKYNNDLNKKLIESSIDSTAKNIEFLNNCQFTSVTIQEYLKKNKTLIDTNFSEKEEQSTSTIQTKENLVKKLNTNSDDKNKIYKHENVWFNNTLNPKLIHQNALKQPSVNYMPFGYPLLHTICFVTCFSESKKGIKSTLDSICKTNYPNTHKLIVVACDGLIKGTGNDKSTPELMLEMIDDFSLDPKLVKPHSYVAVAFGSKRHNMAKVYSGFYNYIEDDDENENDECLSQFQRKKKGKVPIICIVKCGTLNEQKNSNKPGNRGKRDSQVILMSFLEKLFFNDRMSQLEYQILKNIWNITGIMASYYEVVLTIDADTIVFKDSIKHMVAEMCKDPDIMGLCGETQIENKLDTWVTAIQVFEYFISHHQSKAFESVFATVTCLPGCFSMYRIKSPKGKNGFWIPILANPDIVERYSDNVTNSLHKKNLLQLGEDRFLTSLLLKTFPKRKQIFVSKAICKTLVPDTFQVLLSQRRRWINSTIHNLMELVFVNDLCGVFCFSMQFLIIVELIGSVVLPLAICFTIYVILFAIFSEPTPYLTLILLGTIIGLPGVLIILTGANLINFFYMVVYIIALPIWNLFLPLYAFWKFDDFSWGETRVIENENSKKEDEVGLFDYSKIYMKEWREMAREDCL